MQLKREVGRRLGDKVYYKWTVHPPTKIMDELGWEPGTKLEGTITDDGLLLRPLEE